MIKLKPIADVLVLIILIIIHIYIWKQIININTIYVE